MQHRHAHAPGSTSWRIPSHASPPRTSASKSWCSLRRSATTWTSSSTYGRDTRGCTVLYYRACLRLCRLLVAVALLLRASLRGWDTIGFKRCVPEGRTSAYQFGTTMPMALLKTIHECLTKLYRIEHPCSPDRSTKVESRFWPKHISIR